MSEKVLNKVKEWLQDNVNNEISTRDSQALLDSIEDWEIEDTPKEKVEMNRFTTLKKIKEFLQHEVEDHGYLKYQECFSQDQYVSLGRNELAEGLLELISKWEYENG
tara:strand:- start:1471 stop:1791 length:321 start_codon:yes stop_codon:yes gene_type:complete